MFKSNSTFDEQEHELLTALGLEVAQSIEKARNNLLRMRAMCVAKENPETAHLSYIPEGTADTLETCLKLATASAWQSEVERHSEVLDQFAKLKALIHGSFENIRKQGEESFEKIRKQREESFESIRTQGEEQTKAVLEAVKAAQTVAVPTPVPHPLNTSLAAARPAPCNASASRAAQIREPVISYLLNAHDPCMLVVLIKPPLPADKRPETYKLVTDINRVLWKYTELEYLTVVSARWTEEGKCILFTRADQKAADLEKVVLRFEHLLNPDRTLSVSAPPVEMWFNLQISGVSTGVSDGSVRGGNTAVYTDEEVHQELCSCNPSSFAKLEFIQTAQWVRPPGELKRVSFSTVSIALRNKQERDQLLRQKVIFAFAQPVTVRTYPNRKRFPHSMPKSRGPRPQDHNVHEHQAL